MKITEEMPKPRSRWQDADGRQLTIDEISPGDALGREVRGEVDGRPYSCTLKDWARIWRDTAPAVRGTLYEG